MLFFTLGPGVVVYFLATLTTNMQNRYEIVVILAIIDSI